MGAIALIWIVSIIVVSAVQAAVGVLYVRQLRRYQTPLVEEADYPLAAVVLCLRGGDPFLRECLDRIAAQEHPRFQLWIVLDSPSDPAHDVVRAWLRDVEQNCAERGDAGSLDVRLTFLDMQQLSHEASLKTNALRHAIGQLDDDVEAVVLLDADTLTHPAWLRQMTAPLVKGDIGVVSGNRWYTPDARCWGSLIRYVYNAFSVVPMECMQAIWPGSLSMHRRVFAAPEFLEQMRSTSCEDAAILRTLRGVGLRLVYSADCIQLNCEETSLADGFRFVQRQLLWTRLCNSNWNLALAGTILVYANVVLGFVLPLCAVVLGEWTAAISLTLALLALPAFNFLLLEWLHRAVSQRIERSQGHRAIRFTWCIRLRLAAALALTLPFYTLAAVTATMARRVCWRGIDYAVEPPDGIRMLAYAPYADDAACSSSTHSL